VNALTKVLAKEVAHTGTRVNCIARVSSAPTWASGCFASTRGRSAGNPLGRAGEPADIGRAAVFLASEDSGWITGKILRVDGRAWM